MDCNKCHGLLGDFLDGTLSDDDRQYFSAHLEECLTCTGMHAELDRIIALARAEREEMIAPPNGQALWQRIRENAEQDIEWAREARFAKQAAAANTSSDSWWSRLWNARWEFSAPQVTGAFASLVGVAVLSAVLGTGALRNATGETAQMQVEGSGTEAVAAQRVSFDEYVQRQQSDIEYWRQRVEENKSRLPPRVRESFERTMVRLDQDVSYSLDQLRQNPQDDISEEMLNRALHDKVEILRELSSEF